MSAKRPPWLWPLLVGLLLRLVAAACGHGWFAPDDYTYVIEQSGRWLHDPDAPFPCDYRSELFPRAFFWLLRAAHGLGAHDPAAALRLTYGALGLWSLLAIPATYRLARRHADEPAARAAAWMVAAYAIMPRVTTRALIEGVAMVPLAWAALATDVARAPAMPPARRFSWGVAAGGLVGAAALLRFQVGVVFPALLLLVRAWPGALGVIFGGVLAAGAEALVDIASGRPPLDTVWRYLDFNLHHAHDFGVSPWYTYPLQLLVMTIPPVILVLWRPLLEAIRQHVTAAVLLVVFVTAHSFIGHKEDRFMFPILPLFLLLVGVALNALRSRHGWERRGALFFGAVNAIALIVATVSDAQRNLTVPLLHIARSAPAARLATVGLDRVPTYYLGERNVVRRYDDVEQLMTHLRQGGDPPDFILLRHPPDELALRVLAPLACEAPVTYEGDLVDRTLVALNARNKRRSPTAMMRCPLAGAHAQREVR